MPLGIIKITGFSKQPVDSNNFTGWGLYNGFSDSNIIDFEDTVDGIGGVDVVKATPNKLLLVTSGSKANPFNSKIYEIAINNNINYNFLYSIDNEDFDNPGSYFTYDKREKFTIARSEVDASVDSDILVAHSQAGPLSYEAQIYYRYLQTTASSDSVQSINSDTVIWDTNFQNNRFISSFYKDGTGVYYATTVRSGGGSALTNALKQIRFNNGVFDANYSLTSNGPPGRIDDNRIHAPIAVAYGEPQGESLILTYQGTDLYTSDHVVYGEVGIEPGTANEYYNTQNLFVSTRDSLSGSQYYSVERPGKQIFSITESASNSFANGTIGNGNFSRDIPALFNCKITFPALNTSGNEGTLFELGAAGVGCFVGLIEDATFLRIRAGDGGASIPGGDGSTGGTAVLDVPYTSLPNDNNEHILVWDFNPANSEIRAWLDGSFLGSAVAPSGFSIWAGTDSGGYGRSNNNVTSGDPTQEWQGTTVSNLDYFSNFLKEDISGILSRTYNINTFLGQTFCVWDPKKLSNGSIDSEVWPNNININYGDIDLKYFRTHVFANNNGIILHAIDNLYTHQILMTAVYLNDATKTLEILRDPIVIAEGNGPVEALSHCEIDENTVFVVWHNTNNTAFNKIIRL